MKTRMMNDMFPGMQGTKTYAGAHRRLEKLKAHFGQTQGFEKCLMVVAYRPGSDDYIPILVVHDDVSWAMTGFMSFNVGVTK